MHVLVSGLVWIPLDELEIHQLDNIKKRLTVYPKKTTDIMSKADPPPIFMFDETDTHIGVPRNWYRKNMTKPHDETLQISYGAPMQKLSTRYCSDGHYAEQEDAIRVMMNKMEGYRWGGFLIRAGCGWGKALAHGEPVLTPNGYVSIEKISIGDFVAGTDGFFHMVEGVFPQGKRKCYKVTFTDGTHSVCDEDHLWTLEKRRAHGKTVTISTGELYASQLRGKAGRQFWLPEQNPVKFTGSDLPIDPYTLGALIGDGSFCGGIRFWSADGIENFMRLPDGCHFVKEKSNSGSAIGYRIVSKNRDNKLLDALKGLGLFGMDSHWKWIPHDYMYSTVDDRLALLQGLFDTDGSPISSGLVEYSTVSRDLAHNVKFIVETLGGTCVKMKRLTSYTGISGKKVGPFESFRLSVKLPRSMPPFRLHRKQLIIESSSWQRKIGRAVEKVEKLPGKMDATCISVDSPDRLFLTRGCVPTHNTACALEFARRVGLKTLILVHKEFFLDQWKSRIKHFMPDAKVGIVRQSKCEYEDKDFVIAMVQSLARDGGDKYSDDLYKEFGIVISDECHRVAAPTWSSVIHRFNAAWRLGLSATPRRKDGAQDVFFNHISDISFEATTEAQIPKLRILYTNTQMKPIVRGRYRVDVGDLNSAQILTQLGEDDFRSKDIVDQVVLAVCAGRKVMVVSERIQHLKKMSDMLAESLFNLDLPFVPRIDFYTGEWFTGEVWDSTTKSHRKGEPKMAKRKREDLERAESANVLFCTKQIIEEGFDLEALDVLVLATPVSDVEQTVGRVRRWCVAEPTKCQRLCPWRAGICKEKPHPIVLDVVDEEVRQLVPKWYNRQRFYRRIGIAEK